MGLFAQVGGTQNQAVWRVSFIIGALPEPADMFGLRAIQAEALLLILLVALGHGLVWRLLVHYSVEGERGHLTSPDER